MENYKILTWREAADFFSSNKKAANSIHISSLITTAKKFHIGTPVSFQKTAYTKNDLENLQRAINFWKLLEKEMLIDFSGKQNIKIIQENFLACLSSRTPLLIYSVFCPSYQKGLGAIGYTGHIGAHTKKLLSLMASFILKISKIGVETRGLYLFSDLLLENYEKLQKIDYKGELKNNYKEFQEMIKQQPARDILESKLLSEIPSFNKKIGEKGITSGPLGISKKVYLQVLERNKVFYKNQLGWSEEEVVSRTQVLARSYSFMGKEFKKISPKGIMFWSESAYERGRMYQGEGEDPLIPIIYPRKDE